MMPTNSVCLESRQLRRLCRLVFDTDGRPFAGADASIDLVVFIAFFLKPLSVTLLFAVRFTGWETASRARSALKTQRKLKP